MSQSSSGLNQVLNRGRVVGSTGRRLLSVRPGKRLGVWACLWIGFAFAAETGRADVVIFSENMGSGTAGSVTEYTGWQNQGSLSFDGSGDVRITQDSSGYQGASSASNVFLTGGGARTFQISGINTIGFLPDTFDLAFGAFKSTTTSTMSELLLEYSTDGTTYTGLAIPGQPTGSGTASWRLITLSDLDLPQVSNLRLRWTNTAGSTIPQFRLDDVRLSATAIPEPHSAIALLGLTLSLWTIRRR
jgi:hypothetical protein